MRSEGYGIYYTWFVSLSVCLSVTATTRNDTTKERYQNVQRYTGLILNCQLLAKVWVSADEC